MGSDSYMYQVGQQGQSRLELLHRLYAPYSYDFIKTFIPLNKTKRILDIGCGAGYMSFWLAGQIAGVGTVTGIDISQEQVEILIEGSRLRGLNNIHYLQQDAMSAAQTSADYDFTYTRFMMEHLTEPMAFLQQIKASKGANDKQKRYLIIDEAMHQSWNSSHHRDCLQTFRQTLLALGDKLGVDFNIGLNLYSLLHSAGFKNIKVNCAQPVLNGANNTQMILAVLEESRDKLIMHQVISHEKLNALIEKITNIPSHTLIF
ncbi:bifunctional 2-polyprenyl-6-hydroxyphenol methylase/3-demethylubiquinol 3-O-methyltransferase UbiG [uncultured Shewanella sp.]|uniref:class I SAM-dependent methyltransferase n=1 Tax=uncultured Shewanella sp. TaxID=173975 RepID=UPI00260F3BFF|nr:class I SAM-dependent methyltransferase [uncultured Shewanella sp.]